MIDKNYKCGDIALNVSTKSNFRYMKLDVEVWLILLGLSPIKFYNI